MAVKTKKQARWRRHMRIRSRISGNAQRPRLAVHLSSKHIRTQLVDDTTSSTVVSAATDEKELCESGCRANIKGAETIGKLMAERALTKDIKAVVFDRGGFRYHGIVKAIADSARAGGLQF